MRFTNSTYLLLVACLVACAGCNTLGGGKNKDAAAAETTEAAAVSVPEASPADREEQLRQEVRRDIESEMRSRDEDANKVIRREPYFYREYSVYPSGADNLQVTLQEQESRTRPLLADVEVEKQRFSTKLHRKREEASRDVNFIRDTGTETITYELRGGKWVRIGSLYVADKTEEQVNGEWVPLREEVERTVAAEEEVGWFGRQWNRVKERF
ncbi:MAG: hypothetical protein IT368_12240 [Candidatus Hydrogenedentes bacterium]|nr:hypothetical protein [Candidatus Hydrogenedentota bacterium]